MLWHARLMSNTFSQVYVVPLAILAHLENGRLERRGCRNQILLPTGKKCYVNFQNVASGFWIADNEKNTSFWVVFQVHT
jgi:hypothetical protein